MLLVEENLNQLGETHHSAKRFKQGVDFDSLRQIQRKEYPFETIIRMKRDEIRTSIYPKRSSSTSIRECDEDALIVCVVIYFKMKAFIKVEELAQKEKIRYAILVSQTKCSQSAKKKCEDLMRQEQSIQAAFVKLSNQTKLEHKIRLKASIEVARLLLNQGLAFRGHREDESSLNKGNFLEILSWYAKRCDKIDELVLKKAPKNDQMTSHKIQKDIVIACKLETIKAIMEDLNGDYFSLLVDESCDISRKEQMAIKLLLTILQHSLSLSFITGQCYDGASNMQGRLSGLKVLIQQQSKSAHAIHCFAHQLQLTLVGVSKKCLQVGELVLLVSNVLNVVGGSFKRMDELRESQAKKVQVALDMGEVESGKGLNQELGLARDANTRWEKAKATGYLKVCQTFEIAFILHLMRDILAITNELNESLQKKEQDIANAILLVKVVKKRLQDLRNEGWDSLIENVCRFCVKYDILIPNFDEFYVNFGRSRRKVAEYTISHHYRVEVFFKIIDWQLQELNDRFNELETYIVDVRDVDKRFSNLKGLGDLYEMLVKPYKICIAHVALLQLKELSAMKLIKSEL
ncbi:hypothetical protein H5410_003744 [Solanum commersonii]|uniref:DUF4371 domain-containing protein n=1 Tax=Solanum commersonii TaxID=4109 RepID=A0A9J6B5Y5_SOLCO|nr:hypothetical protein H5410_003744 [Solanum commersonii]